MLDNAGMSLAKSDRDIAERCLRLGGCSELTSTVPARVAAGLRNTG